MRTALRLAAAAVLLAMVAPALCAAPAIKAAKENSRSATVHRIPLYDDLDQPVAALNERSDGQAGAAEPFSLRTTCGKCHDYDVIRGGWHFNAADPKVEPGRPAQPWVLVDRATGTWLPITSRVWPHAYRPEDVGLSAWQFIQDFGHHFPGGGLGEDRLAIPDVQSRWFISGNLEINCQGCHSADPAQDQSEWATQIARQNLRWAGAAASGLALVEGAVATLPDTYNPMTPETLLDFPEAVPPKVLYDKSKFDPKGNVVLAIPKVPVADRCYYCHTNRPVGRGVPDLWATDQDVHLAAGMKCADCHRNALDHKIRRGYEGEIDPATEPALAALSCHGCHLGEQSAAGGPNTLGGRLGAPVPKHVGLPPVHLERLSCTACHSGPWPGKRAGRVQTGRIHGLGVRGLNHPADQPPIVAEPVFVVEPWSGKTAPQRMMWPAFWGCMADGKVTPLPVQAVTEAAADAIRKARKPEDAKTPGLTADQVMAGLGALRDLAKGGAPVYIAGGRLYRISDEGTLASEDGNEAAAPYSWPLAHDVRPATQSLGVSRNCSDCHSDDSPFFFGEVEAAGPAAVGEPVVVKMYEFQARDPATLHAWALSYQGRPVFKIVGYAAAAVLAALLILYLFYGLAAITRWMAGKAPRGTGGGLP